MAGRRPKKTGERLDAELRIRLTPEQRAAIDAAAKKSVLESSTWARSILVREAENVNKGIAAPLSKPI
jgi:uncharacterized protein (DUF1778 family)